MFTSYLHIERKIVFGQNSLGFETVRDFLRVWVGSWVQYWLMEAWFLVSVDNNIEFEAVWSSFITIWVRSNSLVLRNFRLSLPQIQLTVHYYFYARLLVPSSYSSINFEFHHSKIAHTPHFNVYFLGRHVCHMFFY